ncbi:MAG: hypothetical protein RR652_04715, partial [Mucinivorans sp.]
KRKAREFHYTPVFWDKEQEEREERRRAILGDDYQSGEYKPGSMIRENRMRRMRSSARVQRSSRSTLIRVAIFVALVFFALYYMTDVFSKFM